MDPSVRSNVAFDLRRIGFYDDLLNEIELEILAHAKQHDANTFHLLDSVPGIGKILALVLLTGGVLISVMRRAPTACSDQPG